MTLWIRTVYGDCGYRIIIIFKKAPRILEQIDIFLLRQTDASHSLGITPVSHLSFHQHTSITR